MQYYQDHVRIYVSMYLLIPSNILDLSWNSCIDGRIQIQLLLYLGMYILRYCKSLKKNQPGSDIAKLRLTISPPLQGV